MKTLTLSLLFFCIGLQAQVGIGNTDPKATLDITGQPTVPTELDGVIAPRLTGDQLRAKTYTTAQTAALVYVTAADTTPSGQTIDVTAAGYYYFNGTKWTIVAPSNDWKITGNGGTSAATNFLGTTDDVNLIFKRNNIQAGLLSNTPGNTAFGVNALVSNIPTDATSGYYNTALGEKTLQNNTTGTRNVAVGSEALFTNTIGQFNTGVGRYALHDNTSGSYNMGVGQEALKSNIDGHSNAAIGFASLRANTSGYQNVSNGRASLYLNTTGYNNTALGFNSLYNSTGNSNTSIGYKAGNLITTGSNNIIIGNDVQVPTATANDQLSIGNIIYGTGITGISGAGNIGIGTTAPTSKMDINGSISMPITTPSGAYTALDTDYTIIANGNITLPAPASTNLGRIYVIYLGSASTRTISAGGTNISNVGSDVASLSMINNNTVGNYRGYTLQSSGSKWVVIGKSN